MKKKDGNDAQKLINDNISLIAELNKIRSQMAESQKHVIKMETLLGISKNYMTPTAAREKLSKAVANYEEIERKHSNDVSTLEEVIKTLSNDNQILKNELKDLKFK